jgi:hypothetical protein
MTETEESKTLSPSKQISNHIRHYPVPSGYESNAVVETTYLVFGMQCEHLHSAGELVEKVVMWEAGRVQAHVNTQLFVLNKKKDLLRHSHDLGCFSPS